MFWDVAKFEARYQAGNPIFWVSMAALFLLGLCGMLFEDLRFGSGPGVHENAPSSIAAAHLLFSILFIFVPAAFMSMSSFGTMTAASVRSFAPHRSRSSTI